MKRLHSVTASRRRAPASQPSSAGRSPLLLALGTALVHVLVAAIAVSILLRPAPRWYVLYEITGTPLPMLSRLAWDLSLWLRRLLPLVGLAAPLAFAADAVLAARFFRRSPERAGWPWFWGMLVLEVVATASWLVAALLLPRRDL